MTKKHAFPVIASRGAFENGTAYTHDAYTSTQHSYEATRRQTPPEAPTPAPAPAEVSRAYHPQISKNATFTIAKFGPYALAQLLSARTRDVGVVISMRSTALMLMAAGVLHGPRSLCIIACKS